jgi:uncharacterized protein YndB with AHSA1/START domain
MATAGLDAPARRWPATGRVSVENQAAQGRVDSASRVILATPRTLFRAFIDPEMLASWRASEGMTARIERFDPRIGGGYRIVLTYAQDSDARGKTSPREDVADVRFVELSIDGIVEQVRFVSDDPAFAEPMTIATSFEPVVDGTKVTFAARAVPSAIDPDDHKTGMATALRNLARLAE